MFTLQKEVSEKHIPVPAKKLQKQKSRHCAYLLYIHRQNALKKKKLSKGAFVSCDGKNKHIAWWLLAKGEGACSNPSLLSHQAEMRSFHFHSTWTSSQALLLPALFYLIFIIIIIFKSCWASEVACFMQDASLLGRSTCVCSLDNKLSPWASNQRLRGRNNSGCSVTRERFSFIMLSPKCR